MGEPDAPNEGNYKILSLPIYSILSQVLLLTAVLFVVSLSCGLLFAPFTFKLLSSSLSKASNWMGKQYDNIRSMYLLSFKSFSKTVNIEYSDQYSSKQDIS